MVIRFAFYGRTTSRDPQTSRGWQLHRSTALIQPAGGQVVAEFFDRDTPRRTAWCFRRRGSVLLAELANPDRGWDAVVVGEPQRAFYGNQFGNTFPLFPRPRVDRPLPTVHEGLE
jgi:site-specific DNA recombinase